ncbi:MAG TPA: hypothetical protein VGR28_13455 [Candidatus Thermoplasmatota archaeon]|nr:hypothetical protein [Candidatus Thermoplasmatota archaeon]
MRTLLLPLALAALALPAGAHTGADVGSAWCGTDGDLSTSPFAHPWALHVDVRASERVVGLPARCVDVGLDGPDLPEPTLPPTLPPL